MVLEGRVQGKGDRMGQSGYAARSHSELPVCTSQSEALSRGEYLPSRFAFEASASLCGTCLVITEARESSTLVLLTLGPNSKCCQSTRL